MKKIKIHDYTCNLCGITNRNVVASKPARYSPKVTKIVCIGCESRLFLRVSVPDKRETRDQVMITLVTVKPGPKLIDILRERKEVESRIEKERQIEPSLP